MAPRTFEALGAGQIERYRGTQCVTVSAAVCLDLNNSKRFKSSRARKFRRSGVSQSDGFGAGGDRTMGATSQTPDYSFMQSTYTLHTTHAELP